MPQQALVDLTSAIQTLIHQKQEYAQVQQHASVNTQTKLQTMFTRFLDALKTNHDQIQFVLQSMEGTPFKYFVLYINGDVVDDISILSEFEVFMQTIEELHKDQNDIDKIESKLNQLCQIGTMIQYITTFKPFSSHYSGMKLPCYHDSKLGVP
ncbi:hypothetical protein BGZ76_006873 [Entomortierella beljakovae]|nr:hypothetical protein BGZ76_006873 [Entomortierella beljakovae]